MRCNLRTSSRKLWLARLISLLCVLVLLAVATFHPNADAGGKPALKAYLVQAGLTDRRRLRTNSLHKPSKDFERSRASVKGRSSKTRSALAEASSPQVLSGQAAAAVPGPQPASEGPAAFEAKPEAYVALCLAVKSEEAAELRHWISHHARLGVGKMYIFDESAVSLEASLQDFIQSGLVAYHHLLMPLGQLKIYAGCLTNDRRKRHQFMGFIDSDEYLVVRGADDLPSMLKRRAGNQGGLGINWRLFGSSGVQEKQQGPVTQHFWKCLPGEDPQSRQIKSIVSTKLVKGVGPDPHTFLYQPGYSAVSMSGEPIESFMSNNFEEDSLVLYHYVTKSREEFQAKMLRGSGMGNHRGWEFFDEIDKLATDDCTDLLPPSRQPPGRRSDAAVVAAAA